VTPLELPEATGNETLESAIAANPMAAQMANQKRRLIILLFSFGFRCSV